MTTPSIREVALVAGISVGTVSNLLNRPSRVAPAAELLLEEAESPDEHHPPPTERCVEHCQRQSKYSR
ncbi:LacI family DNA-binding transcriptional regulator [Pseudofrankia sp. BMG5.37]|uniref:LacI family DNA-binding transcriptional regulator n=1 Tax=Pseudofrankia sp. BMG5.37 TaxID=3050035 RepID=UPI00289551E8|nr:LacI family DNA-binding transcriptional regulator [Pseudofrankia sp. BMG5.37]MDT3442270.1 LacI family DNA-binding transcriptional regulator [Pseudofrankia sp. BMG5.37]